jgi:hypothetical protein
MKSDVKYNTIYLNLRGQKAITFDIFVQLDALSKKVYNLMKY